MSHVEQRVRLARRRLTFNTLLHWLCCGVTAAALAWTLVVLVERTLVLGLPLQPALYVAAGTAAVVTAVGVALRRTDLPAAAAELDLRAGLKERLGSALAVHDSADPFARAAVRDAERVAAGVHMPQHVPIRLSALWPWSAASMTVAAILFAFFPKLNVLAALQRPADEEQDEAALVEKQQISATVVAQLNKVKELAEKDPALKELADALDQPGSPDAPKTVDEARRDALKQLDNVANKLEQRKDSPELNAAAQLKRMLSRLESPQGDDPAAQLSKALASGDTQAARNALEQLQKKLTDAAAKDPAAQSQAAEMQKKLEDLARQIDKLAKNEAARKELENKANLSPEDATRLLDELAKLDPKQLEKELQRRLGESGLMPEQLKELAQKLAANKKASDAAKQIAEAMARAAKACENAGDGGGQGQNSGQAAGALADAADQLSELEAAEQMLNEIDAQLSELKGACEGLGQCTGENIGRQGNQYGQGYGSRVGKEKLAHKMMPAKAGTAQHKGTVIGQTLVDGPQVAGQASAEARAAVTSAVRDATDAIERAQIPRQYERAVREYFERLAGLAGTSPPPPPASAADAEEPARP